MVRNPPAKQETQKTCPLSTWNNSKFIVGIKKYLNVQQEFRKVREKSERLFERGTRDAVLKEKDLMLDSEVNRVLTG